jgi:hypothetical protein
MASTSAESSAAPANEWPSAVQVEVHGGDRVAEPVRLGGEVTADLVGVQVALGHQVADAGGGHPPAVGGVGQELREHAERGRFLVGLLDGLDPAERGGDVLAADLVQCAVDFQVGADAGLQPAEELEDVLVAVDQRGVGLLRADRPAAQGGVDLRLGQRGEAQTLDGGVLADQLQQPAGEVRVVQPRVEGEAVGHGDQPVHEVIGQVGPDPDHQLVALRTAGAALVDVDYDVQQLRVTRDQFRAAGHPHGLHRPGLAGEPPLVRQPVDQCVGQVAQQHAVCHGASPSSDSWVIWNQ